MRILVTGGAGFIGSHFVKLLLTSPNIIDKISHLTVLDDLTYAGDVKRLESVSGHPKYTFVKGSILNFTLLNDLVRNNDFIFNFAAETHVDNSIESPDLFIHTNVLGVQTIINTLIHNPGKRLVQVSTDEVYGEILNGSSTENDILNPSSPYSASKAGAEMLIMAAAKTYGISFIITRGSNTYGPGQFPEKIIPKFIRFASNGDEVPVYGDGRQIREWIHVLDHANGIWLAGTFNQSNIIFNLGSGIRKSNLDLISDINQIRADFQLRPKFVEDRPGHDRRYSIDSSKAKHLLRFSPTIDFSHGLRDTIENELSNL